MYVFFCVQKGQKSDAVSVLVRLEFGDRTIGEVPKVECSAEQESEVNYSTTLPFSAEDAFLIDELASKPLLCRSTVHFAFPVQMLIVLALLNEFKS